MVRWVDGIRRTSIERPWRVLVGWALVVGVLGVLGLQVQDSLSSSVMEEVPGSQSAAAQRMDRRHFGENVTVPILLTGPEQALDRQGPRLVRELRASGDIRTLSPWDSASGSQRLSPRPRAAMVSAAVDVAPGTDSQSVLPQLRQTVNESISAPVTAHISGVPAIAQALQDESVEAAHSAEKWAVPALIIVLLLVFRSLVAAAIPLVVGVATVTAGYGVLVLLSGVFSINIFASNLVAMMGLALGVDYSLLIVSRFREELQHGAVPGAAAASAAASTAGRTVAVAGIALVSAMAVALVVTPSQLLLSAVLGVMVAAVLAAGSALVVLPALLTVLGPNVDRWAWHRRRQRPAAAAMARRALRRPAYATLGALALLVALLAPAFGLQTGPMDARELPQGNPVREDFELLQRTMGEGWAGPFEILVVADEGRITEKQRLEALERWQRRISRWPAVDTVVGPGAVADTAEQMRQAEKRLAAAQRRLRDSGQGLQRLQQGLGRAAHGTRRLGAGLAEAADALQRMEKQVDSAGMGTLLGRGVAGAVRLAEGLDRALAGARRLGDGAEQAEDAAQRLGDGMGRLAAGARRARAGGADAQDGARELADRLRRGARRLERLKEPAVTALREVGDAQDALEDMTVGKTDPKYAEALRSVLRAKAALSGEDPVTGRQLDPRYPGLPESLDRAAAGMRRAAAGADRLADGLADLRAGLAEVADGAQRLRDGTARLADGVGRLAAGNERLAEKLAEAQAGAQRMADGLTRLQAGAAGAQSRIDRLGDALGRIGSGVAEAANKSGQLSIGLRQGRRQVTSQFSGGQLARGAEAIDEFRERSPHFFDSGYYVLAGLQGASTAQRDRANFALDLENGGNAGRILVVPEGSPEEPQTDRLAERLQAHADDIARAGDVRAAVGGQAGLVHDFSQSSQESFVWLLAGLSLVSYLVLVPVFRALLLPAISVLLNVITVGAALGLLALLFTGSDPLLGGPGHINILAMNAIVTVIFALSIDYQVFLISRMREGYVLTGDGLQAIRHGIDHTARIITGAAVIMAAVFIAFAFTDVTTTQVFGVGLAAATVLDATLVRLVLLPGLMRLCGRWTWWMPRWLDRLLPRIDLEGDGAEVRREDAPAAA